MGKLISVRATNMFNIPNMKLPLLNQGLVLIDGKNKDGELVVNNGTGKTNVSKIIQHILYGQSHDGDRGVVMQGADRAEGSLLFKTSGGKYRVTRTWGKKSSLTLTGPDGNSIGNSMADRQVQLINLIGQPFKLFKSATLFAQNDRTRFADMDLSDTARKEILKYLLLDDDIAKIRRILSTWAKGARERIASREREVASLEHAIELIEVKVESEQDKAEQRVRRIESEIRECTAKIKSSGKVSDARAAKRRRKKLMARLDAMDFLDLEGFEKALVESTMAANDAMRVMVAARDERMAAGQKYQTIKSTWSALKSRLDGGGKCPECGAPLDVPHARKKVHKLQSQKRRLLTAYEKADEKWQRLNAVWVEAEESKNIAAEALNTAKGEAAHRSDLEAEIKDLGIRIRRLNRRQCADIAPIKKKRAELRRRKEELVERSAAAITAMEEELRVLRTGLGRSVAKLNKSRRALLHYEWCNRAFGDAGLPSFAVEDALPELNGGMDRWLGILSGGDIYAEFEPVTPLKSGGVRDKIRINTVIEGVVDKRPSGAQGAKIALAGNLSLRDMLERRGRHLDYLFIDEALDSFDELSIQCVVDLLMELRRECGTIHVVSQRVIADVFDKRLTLEKEHGRAAFV